ncbi:MAG: hypothetical protein IKV52_04305, partial [Oscillospiraceae bacterium]|nr:hypothetical protein [Oscillospiraceae bacterium]
MHKDKKQSRMSKGYIFPVILLCGIALGSIIGWGAFVMPGTTFLPKAGPMGTLIGMSVAACIMIIIAF